MNMDSNSLLAVMLASYAIPIWIVWHNHRMSNSTSISQIICRNQGAVLGSMACMAAATCAYEYQRANCAPPEDVHLHYAYTDGALTGFTDARNKTWQYAYTDGRLTTVTTPEGHPSLRMVYDDLGRATQQIVGEATRDRFVYDAGNRTTTIIDAYGNQTVHVYDDKFRLVESRNAAVKNLEVKAVDLLSQVGLQNRTQHKPYQLSGGYIHLHT